jgi:Integrase core domain
MEAEAFSSLLEARTLLEDWRIEYNIGRPHSVLEYLTPGPTSPRLGPRTSPNPGSGWINNWPGRCGDAWLQDKRTARVIV